VQSAAGLYALLLVTDARRATRVDADGGPVRLADQDRSRWDRAVPLAMVAGPAAALAEVIRLERDGRLSGYQYLPAVKADLLSRLGRANEAADAYRQALALATNEAEQAFLAGQLAGLPMARLLPVDGARIGDDDGQRRDNERDQGHDHGRENREPPDQGPGQHNQHQADAHHGEVGPPPGGQAERARLSRSARRRRTAA